MKKFLLLLNVLFIFFLASAQLTQVIKGNVVDKESKVRLPGANIIQLNTSPVNGTASNTEGNFKLTAPIGRISIKISFIGYEDVIIPEILVIAGKETYLNIEMRESVSKMQEVVVKSQKDKAQPLNSMASISARMISTEDASRYAAGYNDPARMVSSFAGVAPTEGDKNDIVIRGNSPRGLLWRLEGIEIPNPNHFSDGQGDAGGSFCIITSNVLANSDFYTGAFPAEYGNALSGILDLNLRKGNADKREYAIQAGIVGSEACFEGPIGDGNGKSYLINYRYANFQPLNKLGLIDLGENRRAPVFQDLALNINLPTQYAGTFSFFGVGGMSATGKYGIEDSLRWKQNGDLRTDEIEDHKMGVIGLKHNYTFSNKKTFLKTIIAATAQYDKWDMGSLITKKDSIWYKGSLNSDYGRFRDKYNTFFYPALEVNSTINHKFNANHTLRAGLVFNIMGFSMYAEEYNYGLSYTRRKPFYNILIDKSAHTSLSEAFIQWKYRLTEKLEFNSGFNSLLFQLNNHYSIEPRLGLKWQFTEKSALSYGFGIHSRIESISAYYTNIILPDGSSITPNKNINFTRAIHNVIGYDWSISPDIRLKAEGYYQYLFDVPIKDNPTSTVSAINFQYGIPDTVFTNKGEGVNKGIEITMEKFYSNDYYFLITVSLYDSKFKAGDGKWHNTYFNGKYVTNWLGGRDFKMGSNKQNIFGVNLKIFLKGGFRYTPVDLINSKNNLIVFYDRSFEKQLPYLLRFDLGLKYRKNNPGYSWIVSLDIQNLLDRQNILAYDFQKFNNKWTQTPEYGLGRVPILNFRIEF
jgi:hypothetical protein